MPPQDQPARTPKKSHDPAETHHAERGDETRHGLTPDPADVDREEQLAELLDPLGDVPPRPDGLADTRTVSYHDHTRRESSPVKESKTGELETGESEAADVAELRPVVEKLKQLSEVIQEADCRLDEAAAGDHRNASNAIPRTIGKYEIREKLGEGGQAAAYLAFDPDLRRHVVLKVYHAVTSEQQREQVLREGQLLARLKTPHVAQCYGAERNEGVPYLVMEYIRGSTLSEMYCELRPSVSKALRIVREIAEGLTVIHAAGLIHRDIKPGNIILGEDGRSRLVDFGLASFLASEELSTISGTPRYMPPEQARGELELVDHRSDLFGLGAVLYELLTGRGPFDAATPTASLDLARQGKIVPAKLIRADLDDSVNQLCMKCLEPAPTNRPETAKELIAAIDPLLEQRQGWAARYWPFMAAGALVVALALLFMFRPARPTVHDSQVANPNNNSSGTPAGDDQEPTVAATHPLDGRTLRNDFSIQVSIEGAELDGDQAVLREGDVISIRLAAERDCYVGVWSVEGDTVVQLFPNESDLSGRLLAQRPRIIPGEGDGQSMKQIRVTPSVGKEFVHVVASTHPLPKIVGQSFGPYVVLTTDHQRSQWRDAIRGMVVEDAPPTPDADKSKNKTAAISEYVLPYRVLPK